MLWEEKMTDLISNLNKCFKGRRDKISFNSGGLRLEVCPHIYMTYMCALLHHDLFFSSFMVGFHHSAPTYL